MSNEESPLTPYGEVRMALYACVRELQAVKDWAIIEKIPLRIQEVKSIGDTLDRARITLSKTQP